MHIRATVRIPAEEPLVLQGVYRITHGSRREAELAGELADPAQFDGVVEQEAGLDRAEPGLRCPLAQQREEDLTEPLERRDDLGVYATMLRRRVEDGAD
jgi:hypothetical protein